MGLNCRIKTDAFGKPEVFNADGTPSQLYKDLKSFLGDEQKALEIWSETDTDTFTNIFSGKLVKDITVDDVIKFHDSLNSVGKRLSPEQKVELGAVMRDHGYNSLSSLHSKLVSIFKPNGIFTVDYNEAVSSGLYSQEDLKGLDFLEINKVLTDIEGELSTGEMYKEEDQSDMTYKDRSVSPNSLGIYPTITESNIIDEVVQNTRGDLSVDNVRAKILDLPYNSFVERFLSDQNFSDKILNNLLGLKNIPILSFDTDGNLKVSSDTTGTTIKNTILDDKSSLPITASLEYLERVDRDLWDRHQEAIVDIIKKAEKQAIEANIDIIGLRDLAQNREDVLDTLWYTKKAIENPKGYQDALIKQLEKVLPKTQKIITEKLSSKYSKLNIVKVQSNKTDNQLFQENGLIKVGESLYHKVDNTVNPSDLYEYIYKKFIDGELELPKGTVKTEDYKSLDKKVDVLKDIEIFINTRNTGLDIQDNEKVSLYQVAFGHNELTPVNTSKVSQQIVLASEMTEAKREAFITKFYNYVLNQKFENTLLYREVLQHFSFNDADIVLDKNIESLDGIPMQQELIDYIRTKKSTEMDYLLPIISPLEYTNINKAELLEVVNFPKTVTPIEALSERPIKDSGMYILPKNSEVKYFREGGKTYRLALSSNENSVYAEYPIKNTDPLYYTTNTEATYNSITAKELLAKYDSRSTQKVLKESTKESIEKSGIASAITSEMNKKKIGTIKSITELINRAGVVVNGSRISLDYRSMTDNQVRGAIREIYQKLQTNLKQKLGESYNANFISIDPSGFSITMNPSIEAINRIINKRNGSILTQQESEAIKNSLKDAGTEAVGALEQGINEELLNEIDTNTSEKLKNSTAAIVDSKIDLLPLQSGNEEKNAYNKIGDCD
jgi:hypothetical protein